VQRTPEEKWKIVLEGLKSGNVAETCRKYEIAPNLYYRWKDEVEAGANDRTPAILQDCHSERVQPAPGLRSRWQDHRCYTVRPTQPFPSILQIQFPSCWLPALPLGSYTWETEPFRCRRHLAIPGDGFMRTRVCQTESVPMPPCKCAQRGPPTLSSQRYSHLAPR
jgi:Transposase